LAARAVLRNSGPHSCEYDIEIVGDDGRVYDRMEGYYNVRVDG
jgi:hypothetical protein